MLNNSELQEQTSSQRLLETSKLNANGQAIDNAIFYQQ